MLGLTFLTLSTARVAKDVFPGATMIQSLSLITVPSVCIKKSLLEAGWTFLLPTKNNQSNLLKREMCSALFWQEPLLHVVGQMQCGEQERHSMVEDTSHAPPEQDLLYPLSCSSVPVQPDSR